MPSNKEGGLGIVVSRRKFVLGGLAGIAVVDDLVTLTVLGINEVTKAIAAGSTPEKIAQQKREYQALVRRIEEKFQNLPSVDITADEIRLAPERFQSPIHPNTAKIQLGNLLTAALIDLRIFTNKVSDKTWSKPAESAKDRVFWAFIFGDKGNLYDRTLNTFATFHPGSKDQDSNTKSWHIIKEVDLDTARALLKGNYSVKIGEIPFFAHPESPRIDTMRPIAVYNISHK